MSTKQVVEPSCRSGSSESGDKPGSSASSGIVATGLAGGKDAAEVVATGLAGGWDAAGAHGGF